MISFGIMTVLFVGFACLVHYDLLGVFPIYPYGWKTTGREPVLNHNNIWLPKPGTDAGLSSFRPIVLYDVPGNGDDGFWTDVEDADDDDTDDTDSGPPFDTVTGGPFNTGSGTSCTSDRPNVSTDDGVCTVVTRPPPSSDHVENASAEVPSSSSSSSSFDYIDGDEDNDYNDYDEYVAPGEERDDDVY